jgi:hypothetical protein
MMSNKHGISARTSRSRKQGEAFGGRRAAARLPCSIQQRSANGEKLTAAPSSLLPASAGTRRSWARRRGGCIAGGRRRRTWPLAFKMGTVRSSSTNPLNGRPGIVRMPVRRSNRSRHWRARPLSVAQLSSRATIVSKRHRHRQFLIGNERGDCSIRVFF